MTFFTAPYETNDNSSDKQNFYAIKTAKVIDICHDGTIYTQQRFLHEEWLIEEQNILLYLREKPICLAGLKAGRLGEEIRMN